MSSGRSSIWTEFFSGIFIITGCHDKKRPDQCPSPATEQWTGYGCSGLGEEKFAVRQHRRYTCVLNSKAAHSQRRSGRCISWLTPGLYRHRHRDLPVSFHALQVLGKWGTRFWRWENHKSRNQWSHRSRRMLSWNGRRLFVSFALIVNLKDKTRKCSSSDTTKASANVK